MRRWIALLLLAGCQLNPTGLVLAPGWQAESLAVWRHMRPDMLAPSPNGREFYVSFENPAGVSSPSLGVFVPRTRKRAVLLYGLHLADGLKLAPDGSLWIGEEHPEGLIWRITDPERLPAEQIVERAELHATHPAIAPLPYAGRFAHEGIAFSRDGRYAYLADEAKGGCVYRLSLRAHRLEALTARGWILIRDPFAAKAEARRAGCTPFQRIEDMETLPDGRILMAETETARIWALDDRGKKPSVAVFLADPALGHPDNLAWDEPRRWLWITDDSLPSRLLAWDGARVHEVARHPDAEITGAIVVGEEVWINLQRKRGRGPDLTVALRPKRSQP